MYTPTEEHQQIHTFYLIRHYVTPSPRGRHITVGIGSTVLLYQPREAGFHRVAISSTCGGFHPTESDFFDEHFREKMIVPRVFADGEDTHSLRLKSELFDLRSGYANRFPCASHAETRCEMGVAPSDTPKKKSTPYQRSAKSVKKPKPRGVNLGGVWSCYPDSDRGPHPYQGCALPAEP